MMASALIERELDRARLPLRTGALVAVVGPSGAGKDTLIDGARAYFTDADDILFVRRVVTRPAGDGGEAHRSMDPGEFDAARQAGAFALSWEAHGLKYGLPVVLDAHLASGHVAVVNGSRAALPLFAERYRNLTVVNVTARPDILARRLAARGRESEEAILARLGRSERQDFAPLMRDAATIDNSGEVAAGVERLVEQIRKAMAFAAVAGSL